MNRRFLLNHLRNYRPDYWKNYDFDAFRGDLFGGVTAMVVALPLALAYGVVSGMGAAAGLYGAVAVGFFAAVFGGTRTQVSGPTAPVAIVVAAIVATHTTSIAEALAVIVLAGLLQVALGALRIGRFVAYTPYVVVSGFMSGIGFIVMLIQVLPFLGAPPAPGGVVGMAAALPAAIEQVNADALLIGLATLTVAALWPPKLARFFPAPLLALLTGTLMGALWLDGAPVIGKVPTGLPAFQLGLPPLSFLAGALEPAIVLALISSVVSLLTALVADSMTGTRHDPDRELIGLGLGNMAAGMFGGLPGAGTPVYTVPNIRAGGRTRMSGVSYAAFMLAIVLGLGGFVEAIPLAALAGVLMKVGWDIIDWFLLLRLHRLHRERLVILLLTLGLTMFVDLISAVAMGLIAAGMTHARQLERLELDSVVSVPLLDKMFFAQGEGAEEPAEDGDADPFAARVGLVALRGSFTVASSHKLVGGLSMDIKEHEVVIFDFSGATYIDDSAAMVVKQLLDVAVQEKTEFLVIGLSGDAQEMIHSLDILSEVPPERILKDLDEAREAAREILRG